MSTLLQKHCFVEVKQVDDTLKRVTCIVSTDSVDRDEEIILPSGWVLDQFQANPLFLWQHLHNSDDPDDLLGRVISIEVVPAGLLATFEYDVDINPKALKIFEKVKKGTLRAFSVGFIPLSWVTTWSPEEHIEALPDGPREALKNGRCWIVYTSALLLEISQVKIPSNPDAMLGSAAKAAAREKAQAFIRQMEEAMQNKTPDPAKTPDAVTKSADAPAPDLAATLKSAMQEALAPVVEALQKIAPPATVEKQASEPAEQAAAQAPAGSEKSSAAATVPDLRTEALTKLAGLSPDQLEAVLADMKPDERSSLIELLG